LKLSKHDAIASLSFPVVQKFRISFVALARRSREVPLLFNDRFNEASRIVVASKMIEQRRPFAPTSEFQLRAIAHQSQEMIDRG
jgi:hypothetical protein